MFGGRTNQNGWYLTHPVIHPTFFAVFFSSPRAVVCGWVVHKGSVVSYAKRGSDVTREVICRGLTTYFTQYNRENGVQFECRFTLTRSQLRTRSTSVWGL